jgi:hypothetical protein
VFQLTCHCASFEPGVVGEKNLERNKIVEGNFPSDYSFIVVVALAPRTLQNVKCALETRIAEWASLCVTDTAGADHLVFPLHFRAFQPPLCDDAFDYARAFFVVLCHTNVRGELMNPAIDVVIFKTRREIWT